MRGYVYTPVRSKTMLPVGDGHQLHVEECGNPNGLPIVFLHGGPGGAVTEKSRRFFNPEKYRIILFDQRGCGQSQPLRSLKSNTTFASVADMEIIREYFGLSEWLIFGGSYGSTLALTYAIMHPERVGHLFLRGVFLGRQSDIDWMIERGGASEFFPAEHESFAAWVQDSRKSSLVAAYYQRMCQGSSEERAEAAKRWAEWEGGQTTIQPDFSGEAEVQDWQKTIGLLEAHYFAQGFFPKESDQFILNHPDKLAALSMDIVHGRFDTICRLSGAYELARVCPKARLHIMEESSHSPYEAHMFQKLVELLDDWEPEN